MRILKALTRPVLTGLFILYVHGVNGQATHSSNPVQDQLTGMWGMFKDKHPDGWGSFDPPYMYVEFRDDSTYSRIWLHKKGNSMVFGKYEVAGDSLLVFHESVVTNGKEKGIVKANTVKLYRIKRDVMEIWEDWDRVLSKRIKKWGHKQKYRPLTDDEKKKIATVKTQLMKDYASIQETEERKTE
ncbi:MAG TPA: hypothetical protein VGK46_11155 [Saprospiraceae bacterium]